jgi:hypothetical protein
VAASEVVLLRQGQQAGRLWLAGGNLHLEVPDEALRGEVEALVMRPLPYLTEAAPEQTVLAVARPGTSEHLRVLMFELRRLGLEARLHGEAPWR